jgi:hypothetical protein
MTFGEALSAKRAEEVTRQTRELEQHLRTNGLSQLESFERTLCLRRAFPRVSHYDFNRIVQSQKEHKPVSRRTR